MASDSHLSNLATGLAGWIKYEFICNRGYSFSESYLTKPLVELLEASWNTNHRGTHEQLHAVSQWKHPYLERQGRGAKPRLDVAVVGRNTGQAITDASLLAVVEVKWCGFTNPSPNEVLWDLYRLALISGNHPDVNCIFILAGLRGKFDSFLREVASFRKIRRSEYSLFLRAIPTGRFPTMRVDQFSTTAQRALRENAEKYRDSEATLALRIKQSGTVRIDVGVGSLGASVLVIQIAAS